MKKNMIDFKPIEMTDKPIFDEALRQDPPQTSELTFTNVYIWRNCYRPLWAVSNGCVLVIMNPKFDKPFGLPPFGTGNKAEALAQLCDRLKAISPEVRICRAGEEFVKTSVDPDRYDVEEDRDNSDYVYLAQELITLSGNKFHSKKNFVNRFTANYEFEYKRLDRELVEGFLDLQEKWCELKECVKDPDLFEEDRAVYEALTHYTDLDYVGGAIYIHSKVEAFAIGERLNESTGVIHLEKANTAIPGLYAAINQRFCTDVFSDLQYVNREQDLGVEGLRKAKQSYHPHHMVRKFTVIPKNL